MADCSCAISASKNEWGVIPGSMGTRSFIVIRKGNEEAFRSCDHGAGRRHSRTEAFKRFNLDDLTITTEGVECRKDKKIIDEILLTYKNIEPVMKAQEDLTEIRHPIQQILCVKG